MCRAHRKTYRKVNQVNWQKFKVLHLSLKQVDKQKTVLISCKSNKQYANEKKQTIMNLLSNSNFNSESFVKTALIFFDNCNNTKISSDKKKLDIFQNYK